MSDERDKGLSAVPALMNGIFPRDAGPKPDSYYADMREDMRALSFTGLAAEVQGKLADFYIATSDLAPLFQEGLRNIVLEELRGFPIAEQSASRILKLVKKHLDRPLTQEWREKMLFMTPAGQVVSSLTKGTSRKIAAPRPARFRRTLP